MGCSCSNPVLQAPQAATFVTNEGRPFSSFAAADVPASPATSVMEQLPTVTSTVESPFSYQGSPRVSDVGVQQQLPLGAYRRPIRRGRTSATASPHFASSSSQYVALPREAESDVVERSIRASQHVLVLDWLDDLHPQPNGQTGFDV